MKSVKNHWPIDENAKNPLMPWKGWPEGKKFALILNHDVDTQVGHEKCYDLIDLEIKAGFKSSFNFVPQRYQVSKELIEFIRRREFGIGVHGLKHDGKLFNSKTIFMERALRINQYMKDWETSGFTSPAMHHNLEWMHALNIDYCTTTFDTDPFEPQPDGVKTIFPFWVESDSKDSRFLEMPYTLPQDFTVFILLRENNIDIWKKKLDWIADHGGMALLNTHPDYMCFEKRKCKLEEYNSEKYEELLYYITDKYSGKYWNVIQKEAASYLSEKLEY